MQLGHPAKIKKAVPPGSQIWIRAEDAMQGDPIGYIGEVSVENNIERIGMHAFNNMDLIGIDILCLIGL